MWINNEIYLDRKILIFPATFYVSLTFCKMLSFKHIDIMCRYRCEERERYRKCFKERAFYYVPKSSAFVNFKDKVIYNKH